MLGTAKKRWFLISQNTNRGSASPKWEWNSNVANK